MSNSIGLNHPENQDSYLVDGENLLFAIADGVGGYRGAKQASSMAVEKLRSDSRTLVDEESLRDCISIVHADIRKESERLGFLNMGTTLSLVKVISVGNEGKVLCANVGDSPILFFSGKSMERMYYDDSFRSADPMEMFGIVQYIGLDCDLQIHVKESNYSSGDVLLLCSDGITDNLVGLDRKYDVLANLVVNGSAKEIAQKAVQTGFKPDDMTVILLRF